MPFYKYPISDFINTSTNVCVNINAYVKISKTEYYPFSFKIIVPVIIIINIHMMYPVLCHNIAELELLIAIRQYYQVYDIRYDNNNRKVVRKELIVWILEHYRCI